MTASQSTADADDILLAQLLLDLEARGSGALADFEARHPHLTEHVRDFFMVQDSVEEGRPAQPQGVPTELGNYRLLKLLKVGGMGEIHLAEEKSLENEERLPRQVAIKVIRRGQASLPARLRFMREQRVLAQLHQTHIVSLFFAGEQDNWQYFVMPYIEGAALDKVVQAARETMQPDGKTPTLATLAGQLAPKKDSDQAKVPTQDLPAQSAAASLSAGRGSPDPALSANGSPDPTPTPPFRPDMQYLRSVAETMADAADAVQHVHDAGFLHRDLKPSNIMLDRFGNCRLIDFGLAGHLNEPNGDAPTRRADLGPDPTTFTGLAGTPQYMSPEQWKYEPLDARSDIWGLGATLYELLTLRRAFDAKHAVEIRQKVLTEEPAAPRRHVAKMPRDLQAICVKALNKNPAQRYGSANDFSGDLRRWLRSEPTLARPPWWPRRTWMWARRNKGWAAALVLFVLAVFGGVTAYNIHVQSILESESRAEVECRALLDLARFRVRLPTAGRRIETERILTEELAKARANLPANKIDEIDFQAKSIYATTLGVPDLVIEEKNRAKLGGVWYQSWQAAIHPSGQAMVIGTHLGPIRWVRGQPLQRPEGLDPEQPRPRVAYSHDGAYVAFAKEKAGLKVFDETLTRTVMEWNPPPGPTVMAIGFTPDNKRVYVCCDDGVVQELKLPSGEKGGDTWRISQLTQITAAAFSSDSSRLAAGSLDGRVVLYQSDGKEIVKVTPARTKVTALAWSPHNSTVALGTRDGSVQLVNAATGAVEGRFVLLAPEVPNIVFTPDGRWLLAAARNSKMIAWDLATHEKVLDSDFVPFSFSRDGKSFPGTSAKQVAFCDLLLPQTVKRLTGHSGQPKRLAWCTDNEHLVSLDSRFEIRVWNVTSGLAVRKIEPPPGTYFADNASIAISGDAKLVAYASGGHEESTACIFEVATGKELARWPLKAGYERLAPLGNDKFILVREEFIDNTQALRTVAHVLAIGKPLGEKREIRPSKEGDSHFWHHDLTPDGRFYSWSGPRYPKNSPRRVEVYEVATGRLVKSVDGIRLRDDGEPTAQLSPDGRYLVIDADDQHTHMYDLTDRKLAPKKNAYRPTFSSKGRLIVVYDPLAIAASWPKLGLRKSAAAKNWLEIDNLDRSYLEPTAFSPNDRYLSWGSATGPIRVADIPALEEQVASFHKRLKEATKKATTK